MRDFKIYMIVASLLLTIYLVAQYNKPSAIDWKPSLYYNDKIPFGTFILYKQLNRFFPNAQITRTNKNFYDLFHGKADSGSNYLIVSHVINFSKYDYEELTNYLKKGNSAFFSAFDWTGLMADTLKIQSNGEYQKKTTGVNFTNSRLKQAADYKLPQDVGDQYFSRFDTAHAVVLGTNEHGKANFISFKFGKGTLYLLANPAVFTNIDLLNRDGAEYAAKALSYLPAQSQVYWDEYQNGDIMEDESPMRVFFSHTSLQWAYYLTIFSLLLFVFYEMKRRQRIIPVVEPLKNSTVDFVNVVGQVYYEQRNNQNIAHKKITFFLEHLRTLFYLKTNVLDMEFINRLSQKTGIDSSFATELVNHINYINVQPRVSDHELILLNQLIEKFYTQSK